MNTILIAGIVQSGFLTLLLLNKKNKSQSDIFLALWLLFIGIHLSFYYYHFNDLQYKYPHLIGIDVFFPILQGVLLYIYTAMLTSRSNRFKPAYLLHTIPFFFFVVFGLFDFYFLTADEKIAFVERFETSRPPMYTVGFIFIMYSGPVYVVLSLLRLRKHKKNIANNFSYTEEINLSWLRYVIIGMIVVWSTVLISGIRELLQFPETFDEYAIASSIVLAVFIMGYFGFKQHAIYTNISVESARVAIRQHADKERNSANTPSIESYKQQAERYKRSGLKNKDTDKYLNKVLSFMDDEKPYLNNKLSLSRLSGDLNMSTNHLSQILNERLNKNFFDFINEYRVNEFKSRIADPKQKEFTLLAIAYDCGFNSKSSFNSIFKKHTHLTPSEYQKSLQS